MKIFLRNIHLYLSLAAGLVIMVACLTGAILVFERELEEGFHPQRYKVSPSGTPIKLSELIAFAEEALPGSKFFSVKVYTSPNRTVEVLLAAPVEKVVTVNKDREANRIPNKISVSTRPTHTAFVNPYTGKVIEVYSLRSGFFYRVMALHRWLLGRNDGIGRYIVGISTFLFMFILFTGIILWWPKTRKIFIQRVSIKWDGNWKRLNHDLHLVLGFYSAIFLFIFAFTAMSWSFQWFNKGINKITGSSAEFSAPPSSIETGGLPVTVDSVLNGIQSVVKDATYYIIKAPQGPLEVYTVILLPKGANEMKWESYYVDQFSGKTLGSFKYGDGDAGQRIRAYIKPLHTSAIFGIPSKVLGFIVCILGVTFPVTGVIMWLNRLKTERRLTRRQLKREISP